MRDYFFSGLRTILPIVLFVIILSWVVGGLFSGIEAIGSLFPNSMIKSLDLPSWILKTLGLLLICLLIWFIGIISKQPKMSKRFEKWLSPIVYRIPLLSHLYKITNQAASTLQNTNSFKKVVLVQTSEGIWEIGFVTGENPQTMCDAIGEPLISVSIPFSPLTSYRILLVRPGDVKETNISVSAAISFIISMGTAGGVTNEITKESPS